MSDIADRAAAREQELRDDALAEHARRHGGKRQVAASAEDCTVCGEPIPAARQAALPGVQTCVECQAELEYELNHGVRMK